MPEQDLIAEAITEAFGERCPDVAEGCPCCDAWKQYDDLIAERDRCHDRLEIDHHWVLGHDEELIRQSIPIEDRPDEVDGISARDATIEILEDQLSTCQSMLRSDFVPVGTGVFRNGEMIGFVELGTYEYRIPEDTDERHTVFARLGQETA